jgi:hypothetical protein
MRKNLLYIGILLFVIGIGTAFVILPSQASQHLNPVQKQLVLGSGSIGYVALQMNDRGILEALFTSTSPVDFYFTNSTAFSAINGSAASNSTVRQKAISLEGRGVYEIYESSLNGAFPIQYTNMTPPVYLQNITSMMSKGTYYAVFSNMNGTLANIKLLYAISNETSVNSVLGAVSIYGTLSLLLTLGGIALIGASFLWKEKPKQPQQDMMDEQAKREYERIEKSEGKKGKHKSA